MHVGSKTRLHSHNYSFENPLLLNDTVLYEQPPSLHTTHMTAVRRDYSVHIPTLLSTLYYAQLFILSAYTYSNTYSKSLGLAWLELRSCQLVRQANYKAGGNV